LRIIKYLSKNAAEFLFFGITLILQGLLEVKIMFGKPKLFKTYPKVGIMMISLLQI